MLSIKFVELAFKFKVADFGRQLLTFAKISGKHNKKKL